MLLNISHTLKYKEWIYYVESEIENIDCNIETGILNKGIEEEIFNLQRNYIITLLPLGI